MITSKRKRSRRERAAATLTGTGVGRIAKRAPGWNGVLVLNYHRIGDRAGQPWDHTLWNATSELLDAQLAVLASEAEVIEPDQLEAAVHSEQRGRRVLLTFDDGYRDNFEIAYPLLRRHGLPATFFLATGFLDKPHVVWWDELAWMVRSATAEALAPGEWLTAPLPLAPTGHDSTIAALVACYKSLPKDRTEAFLEHVATTTGSGRCGKERAKDLWVTWEMARELRTAGMTIGGHTVNHPVLARLSPSDQEHEIGHCAQRLEQELGEPMRWFAYPVGAPGTFTSDTRRILRERDVRLAFSFYGGCAGSRPWDPLNVPRSDVGSESAPEVLRASLWLPRVFAR